jgi:putative transposase
MFAVGGHRASSVKLGCEAQPRPEIDTMTDERMAFLELPRNGGGEDFLKDLAQTMLQRLMEWDVEGQIGAGRYERSDERATHRNGYRERDLETRLGALELKIPKLRRGSYFPAFLEPRKTAERALVAVIQEAWIQGVSTPEG